jgi:hypothetical protein
MTEQADNNPHSASGPGVSGGHDGESQRSDGGDPPRSVLSAYYPLIVIATVLLVVAVSAIDIWMTR